MGDAPDKLHGYIESHLLSRTHKRFFVFPFNINPGE